MTTTKSPEEKKVWHTKMSQLAAKIRAMPETDQLTLANTHGTITCEGRSLSPFNCCFLAMQSPDRPLLQVGGFRQWQRMGRTVKPGEHAAGYIYVPLSGKKADTEPPSDNDTIKPFFKLVPVFDVNQTAVKDTLTKSANGDRL